MRCQLCRLLRPSHPPSCAASRDRVSQLLLLRQCLAQPALSACRHRWQPEKRLIELSNHLGGPGPCVVQLAQQACSMIKLTNGM